MIKKFALMIVAVIAVACSGGGMATTGSGGTGGSAPVPDAVYETAPISVPAGGDETWCHFFRTTNAEPVDVQTLHVVQAGHHVELYTVDHPIDSAPIRCPQGGQMNWINIAAATKHDYTKVFPPGVGLHLAANTQMVAEVHEINASGAPVDSSAKVEMTYAPKGSVSQQASVFYFGSMNIDVAPQSMGSVHSACKPPFPITIHTGMGHEHAGGTGVTARVLRAAGGTEDLYSSTSWDSAPIKDWDDGIAIGADDSVDVTCEYSNTSTSTQAYPGQMCWFLGYHWSAASQPVGFYCMAAGGGPDDSCTCIPYGGGDGHGGSTLEINVSRKASALGSSSRPVYCFAYASGSSSPNYYGNAVDNVSLDDDTDQIQIRITDISPGTFSISCVQDDVFGGVLPGSGDAASSTPPTVTIPSGGTASVDVALDVVVP